MATRLRPPSFTPMPRQEWDAEVKRIYAERGGELAIDGRRHRAYWDEQYAIGNTPDDAVVEFIRPKR